LNGYSIWLLWVGGSGPDICEINNLIKIGIRYKRTPTLLGLKGASTKDGLKAYDALRKIIPINKI
jgi:hypothetical protein